MLIFVIPSVYPNRYFPGAGVFVREYVAAAAGAGHKMVVLDASTMNYRCWNKPECLKPAFREDGDSFVYEYHVRGLAVSRLPRPAVSSTYRKLRKLYHRAVSEHGRPDVIVNHFTLPAGFAARRLAQEEKLPFAVVEHESVYYEEKLPQFIERELKSAVEAAASFVCVSEPLKRAIEKRTGVFGKIAVIPNMIDDGFVFVPPEHSEGKGFTFFSAGNLVEIKRFDLLIRAFGLAFEGRKEIKLRIAGRGPEEEGLKKLIASLGLSEQVSMIGYVPHDRIKEEYKNCGCFILLSRRETFGVAYREAMAVGRPIIAAKNGGVEENWDDGNGILLENDSVEAVAEAMKRLANGEAEYDPEAISRRCRALYSREIVIAKHDGILNGIVKNGQMK